MQAKKHLGWFCYGLAFQTQNSVDKGLDVRDSKEGEGSVPPEFRGQRSVPG